MKALPDTSFGAVIDDFKGLYFGVSACNEGSFVNSESNISSDGLVKLSSNGVR